MTTKFSKDIESAIQRIYERDGEVKPTTVVREARDKSSPLHGVFEWNDSKAAQQYRLNQARRIIRAVKITVEEQPEQLIHVPTIETQESSREGTYKPVSVVVESQDEFSRALDEALSKQRAAKRAVDLLMSKARDEGRQTEQLALALKSMSIAEQALANMPH